MVATVVRSSLLLVVLVLLAGPGSAAEQTNTTEAVPELTWVCEDVSVQSNLTLQQVLGEWILLELDDGARHQPEDVCMNVSLTDLRDDDPNNRLAVNLAAFGYRGSYYTQENHTAYFPRDRPGEIVIPDVMFVYRVHSLSADGRVLVLAMCNTRGRLVWMTLGRGEDSLPANHPQRSSFSARRDANFCQQLADRNAE